jgi:hypothetical protein
VRILLTNNTLDVPAGSELYLRDVALELARRGHQPIAYSTRLGAVASYLREAGIEVVDRLGKLDTPPDVIHGHHHYETLSAVLNFPHVPAVYFCHGWLPWQEAPLLAPAIGRYIAVDELCRKRLMAEGGIAPGRIELLLNFFDPRRFPARLPLPAVPRRALAFGHTFSESIELPVLREACRQCGVQLDVLGHSVNLVDQDPGPRLAECDLVFAKGRAAIEALAVGAAVILCGYGKLGPLVDCARFAALRPLNFGFRCISAPLDVKSVVARIRSYNASDAGELSERVRRECTLGPAVDRLLEVYEQVRANARSAPAVGAEDVARAAARYLETWSSRYKAGPAVEDSKLPNPMMQEKTASAEEAIRQLRQGGLEADLVAERLTGTITALERRLAETETRLREIEDSATWRWSRRVLEQPFVSRLFGRALRHIGRGGQPTAKS